MKIDPALRILLIEDNPDEVIFIRQVLSGALTETGRLDAVPGLAAGLEKLAGARYDIILLKLDLPDSHGFSTLKAITERYIHIPIVVLGDLKDEEIAVAAIQQGAQDYLFRQDLSPSMLMRVMRYSIERQSARTLLRSSTENIIKNSVDGIMILERDSGLIRFVNPIAKKLLARDDEALIGTPFGFPITGSEPAEVELVHPSGGIYTAELRAVDFEWMGRPSYLVALRDITEQVQAQEKLQASEQRFSTIFNNTPTPKAIVRLQDNQFIEINPAWGELWGFDKQDVLGKTALDIDLWLDSADRTRMMDEMRQTGRVINYEAKLRSRIYGERVALISAGQANINGEASMILQTIDITERRVLEDSLRESNLRFEQIVTSIPEAFWMYDNRANQMLYISPAYEIIYGRSVASLYANPRQYIDVIHPDDRHIMFAALEKQNRGERTEMEYRIVRPDGSIRWIYDRSSPIFDEQGELLRTTGIATDVTQRKQAMDALRASEEHVRLAIETTRLGIWEWHLKTDKIHWDNEMFRIYGITPTADGIVDYNDWAETLTADELAQQEAILQETVRRGAQSQREFQIQRRDTGETRYVYAVESVRMGASGQPEWVVGTNLDITARKQAEIALRQQLSAQKVAAEISQKLVNISNENRDEILLDALASLGRWVGADRCYVFIYHPSEEGFTCLHEWQAEGIQPSNSVGGALYRVKDYPLLLSVIMRGEVLNVPRVFDLPDDEPGVAVLKGQLIRSLLCLPLQGDNGTLGFLGFETIDREQSWDETETDLLRVVGRVIVNGLEHLKYEDAILLLNQSLETRIIERTAEVQDLYDNAPAGYHSTNGEGRLIRVNQTELNWLGYTREEMIGHRVLEFLSESSQAVFLEEFPKLVQTGALRDIEVDLVRKDGTLLNVSVTAVAVYDAQGNFFQTRASLIDVTERKKTDEALRISLKRVNALYAISQGNTRSSEALELANLIAETVVSAFPAQTVLVILTDVPNRRIECAVRRNLVPDVNFQLSFDEAWDGLTGWALRQRKIAWSPAANLPDNRESLAVQQRRLATSPNSDILVVPLIYQDHLLGTITVSNDLNTSTHLGNDDIDLIQSVANQAATAIETLHAEMKLRKTNQELERALRLKDEFLATMSHELRTPLNGILGLSESMMVGTYGALNEKQLRALGNIESSGQHLLELINDILDLSKIEAGKFEMQFEPCSLGELCQASLELTRGMANQKRQSVSFSMNPASIVVRADARRLKQILANLLSNAVKFTPEGGTLGLEVLLNEDARRVALTVWDKGMGISAENLQKLFQPFVQLDASLARQHEGTGLGLSLVQRMAELHGGSVQVDSALGDGSRFTIFLPWEPDSIHPVPQADEDVGSLFRSLTVEDSEIDAETVTRSLWSLGIKNAVYPRGQGAVEDAASQDPDVILLDLHLPDRSGFDVLADLKADPRTGHIPVVICSVEESRQKALAGGAAGYLVKPFTLKELRSELSRVAAEHQVPNSILTIVSQGAHPQVLLVDDNEVTLEAIADFLATRQFRVTLARNGMDLLDRLSESRPDIILMDIQMPGMDGLELIRRVRESADPHIAQVPIIALTALAMPGDRGRCLEAGANEYLSKPVQLQQLVKAMHTLLNQGVQ